MKPGSAAIDAGVSLTSVRVAFDRAPRPAGNGYDAGAYEFGSLPPEARPPTASFAADPTTVKVGVPIRFDAAASTDANGQIVSYTWTFGDGESANETAAFTNHVYARPGSFVVQLTMMDDDGLTDSTSVVMVVTDSQAPIVLMMGLGVAGLVDDPTVSEVEFEGARLPVMAGAFADLARAVVGAGQTRLTLRIRDGSGNTATRRLVVTP